MALNAKRECFKNTDRFRISVNFINSSSSLVVYSIVFSGDSREGRIRLVCHQLQVKAFQSLHQWENCLLFETINLCPVFLQLLSERCLLGNDVTRNQELFLCFSRVAPGFGYLYLE